MKNWLLVFAISWGVVSLPTCQTSSFASGPTLIESDSVALQEQITALTNAATEAATAANQAAAAAKSAAEVASKLAAALPKPPVPEAELPIGAQAPNNENPPAGATTKISDEVLTFFADERKVVRLHADQEFTANLDKLKTKISSYQPDKIVDNATVDDIFSVVIKNINPVRTDAIQAWTRFRDDFKKRFASGGQKIQDLELGKAVDQERKSYDALIDAIIRKILAGGGAGTAGTGTTSSGCCRMSYRYFKNHCRCINCQQCP